MDELNRWYKLFVNCLCDIEESLLIVIDDFHLVDHVFPINYFMEKIIEFAPPSIHFIIASRTLPNWDIMRKLKLQKRWLVMKEDELAFTTEEIAVFFEEYVDVHLSEAEMTKVLEITEGWAISISLLAEQWHHASLDHWLTISTNDLFTYLSEEVYSTMTASEQDTILKLAIFPTFSAELFEAFYGAEIAQILNALTQRHLFIQPVTTDGLYRFHALFSRFLEMKWRQHPSQYTDLHKQAALYYVDRHNIQSVLYHAFKTNDHDFCGELLQLHAESIVRAGQFEWLLEKSIDLLHRKKTNFIDYIISRESVIATELIMKKQNNPMKNVQPSHSNSGITYL